MNSPVTRPVRATWSESQPARNQTRLALALGLSLGLHAILFSLRFGAAGFGWPGLALPWAERRVQASSLIVRLADVPRAPAPLAVLPPAAPESMPLARPPRAGRPIQVLPPQKRAQPRRRAKPPVSLPRIEAPRIARAAPKRDRQRAIASRPQAEILAQAEPRQETFAVPPPLPPEPEKQQAPELAVIPPAEELPAAVKEPEPDPQKLADAESARQRAEEAVARQRAEEAARQQAEEAAARQRAEEAAAKERAEEAARQRTEEAARQRALALQKELEDRRREEAKRQEEASRAEEAKRQEEARAARIALELEALKRAEEAAARQRAEEAARQQAAEAARQRELEAKRQADEAAARARAQELAERQRAEALAAAQLPSRAAAGTIGDGRPAAAPGALSGREMAAKALEQLRQPGTARTGPDFPRAPARSTDSTRRRSLFGSAEQDVGLRMYVDSWRWKLERYGTLNYPPSAWAKAPENPVVTVAIRSDGSLEEVFIHRSSGLRELDEAVRRIARLYAPYGVFPPELARRYDVIEIRRVWFFGETLRILEEM